MAWVNPDVQDPKQLKDSLENLNKYSSSDYFRRWLSPGDFIQDIINTAQPGNKLSCIFLPNAGTPLAIAQFQRPSFWINGYTELTLWHSSNTAVGNNFQVTIGVHGGKQNQVASGAANIISTTTTIAEASAANEVEKTLYTGTTTLIVSTYDLISVKIERDSAHASDTSTGNLYILGAQVRYIPLNQQ